MPASGACLLLVLGIVLGFVVGLAVGLAVKLESLQDALVNAYIGANLYSSLTNATDLLGNGLWEALDSSQQALLTAEGQLEAQLSLLSFNASDSAAMYAYLEETARLQAQAIVSSLSANLWWVGILFDAVATFAGTCGKQMLRKAVTTRNGWYYPLGLFLTAFIDPAFDLVAYSFAAQSIIAACAGLVVVWNVMLAPCTLGEKLTPSRKIGATVICTGTILVGVFGSHDDPQRTPTEYLELFTTPQACGYYMAFGLWACACVAAYYCASPTLGAPALCAFGGSLAGNSFSTKAAVELTECGALDPGCPGSPFASPLFYLFGGFSLFNAAFSLYLLAISLRRYEALYMITVYQGFFVLSGALSGNFVMDEKAGRPWDVLAYYSASIGLVLAGLAILCHGELKGLSHGTDKEAMV